MIEHRKVYSAVCDKCGDKYWLMGKAYEISRLVSLKEDLKSAGWKLKGINCLCPKCKGGVNG